MAAYNAAGFIEEAILNLQQQTHKNWELLVIDDASKDTTTAVVERLAEADPRLRLIKSEKNGGPGAARNLGLAAATGEWITVLDSDDKYAPKRLEKLLAFAEKHNLDIIADNHYLYNLETKQIFGQGFYAEAEAYHLTPEMFVLNDRVGQWFPFGLLKPFYRWELLKPHKLQYPSIRLGEDFCLFFSLLLQSPGKAALLSEPLYIYTPQTFSDRSRTTIDAPAWNNYRAVCRDYLTEQAHIFAPNDRKLIAAIMKRDASLGRYIEWCRLRDPTRPGAFWRKHLVFLKPDLWPMLFVTIKRKLTQKHGIPHALPVFQARD